MEDNYVCVYRVETSWKKHTEMSSKQMESQKKEELKIVIWEYSSHGYKS